MPEDTTKPSKTAEQKEAEKMQKAITKILDEKDEMFCGFCSFNVIDQDGYPKMIKGCNIDGPLFIERTGSGSGNTKVVISASFTPKPHAYLGIQKDSQLYISGSLWYGAEKKSPTNVIGKIIPKTMETIVRDIESQEGGSNKTFDVKCEIPFLKNAPKRLAIVKFETVEERFLTKICGLKIELSEDDWMEWKNYKLQFWKLGKAAGASTEGGGDDDDEKGKDKKKDEGSSD